MLCNVSAGCSASSAVLAAGNGQPEGAATELQLLELLLLLQQLASELLDGRRSRLVLAALDARFDPLLTACI